MSQPVSENPMNTPLVEIAHALWVPKEELTNGTRCATCGIVLDERNPETSESVTCYLCAKHNQ